MNPFIGARQTQVQADDVLDLVGVAVLFRTRARVHAQGLRPAMASTIACSACSATSAKLLRCSGCQGAWYCNAECQKGHWKSHRAECKRLKEAKVRSNTEAGAAELQAADAMKVVVDSDRILICRCSDPDDSVFMQTMAKPGIQEWLEANQVECWCQSVGTFAPSQTIFVVAAFSRAQIEALPQPRSEIELSDHTRERGVLESEPINAFGLRLCVTAAPAMGQISFGLRELAFDPAPPLDAVAGTAVIASCFILSGGAADALVLPPPMSHGFHAGKERENAMMMVWCGIGECATSITASALDALPSVSQEALRAAPLEASSTAPPPAIGNDDVVAIGMLLEQCGASATVDEFEAMSIQAYLHDPHVRQQPQMAVPPFARRLATEPKGVAAAVARSDRAARLSWMVQGKGM